MADEFQAGRVHRDVPVESALQISGGQKIVDPGLHVRILEDAGYEVLVFAATGALFMIIPKGFVPDQDTDQLQITTEAAQGTSFTNMSAYQKMVAEITSADGCRPEVIESISEKPVATPVTCDLR